MTNLKRWLGLALSAALALTLFSPALALEVGDEIPSSDFPVSFQIDAAEQDVAEQDLLLDLYRRDEDGLFRLSSSLHRGNAVNQATGDASFLIRTQTAGVQVTVDYLTDIDNDGIYEMPDGGDSPACDVLTRQGSLIPLAEAGEDAALPSGTACTLTAETLTARGEAALQARRTAGDPQFLPLTPSGSAPLLYLVTLRFPSSETDGTDVVCVYLSLYGEAILPADVPRDAWYADAVAYAMARGFLDGTGEDSFTPDGKVSRAEMAQLLWNLDTRTEAPDPGFSDVSAQDWFHTAVYWCAREGLMNGSGSSFSPKALLTKGETAAVLMNYARYEGRDVSASRALDAFPDAGSVSPWTRSGLEWATATGLMSGDSNGALSPDSTLTRAQLAVLLYNYFNLL